MAKIYGLFGAMTGKLADTVMAVRNGEQIARKYQPVVFNPGTPAQIAQRAKMKLASQLSAVLAPVIAIMRVGSVSSRNMFTKVNYPLLSFQNNQADITLTDIQLTKSAVAIPSVVATRVSGTPSNINVSLAWEDVDINRVVYVALLKDNDSKLRVADTTVVQSPGENGLFEGTLRTGFAAETVVLAYGIRDNNEAAHVIFGNLTAVNAETVAKVITSRTLKESDITVTETVGVNVPVNQ